MSKLERRKKIMNRHHAVFGTPKTSLEAMPLDYIFERSLGGITEDEYFSNRKSSR